MAGQTHSWIKQVGNKIPTTIELDPIIYKYTFPACRILDIGCANGKVSILLALHAYSVSAVDVNTEILSMAKSSCESQSCPQIPLFIKGNAKTLPFYDASFDIAVMQAFLTTVVSKEDRGRIIREACRVLRPHGHLYIADFGQTWHSKIYRERYINDLPLTKEEGSIVAYDEDSEEIAYIAHHFTEKELVLLLIENGFELEYFKRDEFVTRTGNRVNGFVIVSKKQ